MVYNLNVGEKIRKYRKEKHFSQAKLGEIIGCTNSTIAKYENGNLEPNLETLKRIATTLDIPLIELVDDNSNNIPLKGILNNTTSESSISQQMYASILNDMLNSPISLFFDALGEFLSPDDIQEKLHCSSFTGEDLTELTQFLFYMMQLKILEINTKRKY